MAELTETLTGGKRFVDPSVVVSHFHLREGDAVADFGAGSGYFVELFAQRVGQNGKVYACEIQKDLVEKIGNQARVKNISNIYPLWCDLEVKQGIKIADGALDAGVLINTLFQLEDKKGALSEINRTLRSGGKLFVIDWSESFGGLGPQPNDVCNATEAQALVEEAGFVYENAFDAGDHHYGLSFRKI
jgi:ubiquinone/menaquinone biosynthesis C-methylase UbiE